MQQIKYRQDSWRSLGEKKYHNILEGVCAQIALPEFLSSSSPLKKRKQDILESI